MAGNLRNCLCNLVGASFFIAGFTIILVAAFPVAQIAIGAVYMYECPAAPAIPVYIMVCGISALLMMGLLALPTLLCPAAQGNKIWILWVLIMVLFIIIWFLYGSFQIYSVYPPNYIKNPTKPTSINNSISGPTAPDNKTTLTLENKNLPNPNQTWMTNNNHTLRNLIQNVSLSNISSHTKGEHLKASPVRRITYAAPYCDRTVYLFSFWTTTLVYVFAGHALLIIVCVYGFMKLSDIMTKHLF